MSEPRAVTYRAGLQYRLGVMSLVITGCSVRRSINAVKFRGVGKLGGQNFEFSPKNYFDYFWANYAKIHKFG